MVVIDSEGQNRGDHSRFVVGTRDGGRLASWDAEHGVITFKEGTKSSLRPRARMRTTLGFGLLLFSLKSMVKRKLCCTSPSL